MTYGFEEQLKVEVDSLKRISAVLAENDVHTEFISDLHSQRLGIDAVLTMREWRHTVEFKTDMQAHVTGNFFVETISNDVSGTPGWAYTSGAQLLGLFIPGQRRLLLLDMWQLKRNLPYWRDLLPNRSCQNSSYRSHGVLVPLRQLEAISVRNFQEAEAEAQAQDVPSLPEEQDQGDSARGQDGRAPQGTRHHRVRAERPVHPQAQVRG